MTLLRRTPLTRTPMRRRRVAGVPLSVRAAVVERAGNACERCGAVETLDLHHKLKKSQGGKHTEANLVALCRSCHALIEAHPAQAVAEGFGVQLGKVA